MVKRYYSSRNQRKQLSINGLYIKLQHLYLLFRDQDYFKGKTGITKTELPDAINHKTALALGFQPFPITKWAATDITEDHIFDVLEFLHDHISKPGAWVGMTTETGWNYYDYESYDDVEGQSEFREHVNSFLCDYKSGFELTADGVILALGAGTLQQILYAEVEPYDERNVDTRVRNAIRKWRNRNLDMTERRQAIREIADVFEWLKKSKKLEKVLNRKDEAALFDIANNFAIRHHNPKQKGDYDDTIWYSWMFHFYLATYHAVIRLLKRGEESKRSVTGRR